MFSIKFPWICEAHLCIKSISSSRTKEKVIKKMLRGKGGFVLSLIKAAWVEFSE
jgi:hypothetical protein